MMQLRRNHSHSNKMNASQLIRVIVFFFMLAGLLYFGYKNRMYFENGVSSTNQNKSAIPDYAERTYLPVSPGKIVHKSQFSLSYSDTHHSPEWVAYRLNKNMLQNRYLTERYPFYPDQQLPGMTTTYYDFSGSGYERGHLVPAADMRFDSIALVESFALSNIVPQKRACNVGIWKELEKQIRGWINQYGEGYIIAGPAYLNPGRPKKLKETNVSIPDHFFKILLIYTESYKGAVGYLIPNTVSNQPLSAYLHSIDEIEEYTGFDFFHHMLNEEEEKLIEAGSNQYDFPLDPRLYNERVTKWNKE